MDLLEAGRSASRRVRLVRIGLPVRSQLIDGSISIWMAKSAVDCSLVINVARSDAGILRYTLPHIIDTHAIRFAEVVVVIDEQPVEGRISRLHQQSPLRDLYRSLDEVRRGGYEFRQEVVSYKTEHVRRVFMKWFGRRQMSLRCAGGTPIYAFLYGLDLARHDYRLHLDSDMLLYDPGPTSWVCKAIEMLERVPAILFVNQTWGLQTSATPAPESLPTADLGHGQRVSQVFSSRCFLFSMDKLQNVFLPIIPATHPFVKRVVYRIQRRSAHVALEQMIGSTLNRTGTYRADLEMEWGYNLHAWDKAVFREPDIASVLKCIEAGRTPVEHTGQHNLNYHLFLGRMDEAD